MRIHTVAGFASEVHEFLSALDPARTFGDDAMQAAREALDRLNGYASELMAAWDGVPPVSSAEQRLRQAVARLQEALPDASAVPEALPDWFRLREDLSPLYERMSLALAADSGSDAERLRPTNYVRNLFHVSAGLMAIIAFEHLLTPSITVGLSFWFLLLAWGMEISRQRYPAVNRVLMWVFGPVAHPHEAVRVNSATWYTTAVFLICLVAPDRNGVLGLLVLAVGDPAAAILGRRYGRTKLVGNKSLEGTAAFVGAGVLAAAAYLFAYYPQIEAPRILAVAGAAALAGAAAELVTRRLDDNLTIPVSATAAALLVGALF